MDIEPQGFGIGNVISGWLFVRGWERQERAMRAEDEWQRPEWKREEEANNAEWDAFTNWVKQNPVTAERLMLKVEEEQIDDPEHRAWIQERRRTEGPNQLTDMSRLFDCLKAQRKLRKLGSDPDLPPHNH